MSNEWNEDDAERFTVTTLQELPTKKQETRDTLKDSILQLEDKLCSLEAYYHGTKTPSKRIVKALIKRAQYHMRRTRSMYLLTKGDV
jgi:hypothetical protein